MRILVPDEVDYQEKILCHSAVSLIIFSSQNYFVLFLQLYSAKVMTLNGIELLATRENRFLEEFWNFCCFVSDHFLYPSTFSVSRLSTVNYRRTIQSFRQSIDQASNFPIRNAL